MIPQRNLSLLSNRLARAGGRRIVEAVLERDYCLAWFLVGLSRSELREKLLFNGGTALEDNVFLVQNDDEVMAKVLDFGIAKTAQSALGISSHSNTRTGALLGTPYHMSPEQAQGNKAQRACSRS
jgi:hypothetical protein